MQAIIMAGGRGQRLQPLTLRRPKPLVPFFGRPLLDRLLEGLWDQGVDEVFITAGHLAPQIEAFVAARGVPPAVPARRLGPVHVAVEAEPRGTAGAVADLLPQLRSPFAVFSGDALLDLDLAALVRTHLAAGNVATICLAPPAEERLRFGTVALRGSRIARFLEKPRLTEVAPGLGVNTGCYVLDREALAEVAQGGTVDFAYDVFPRLLAAGLPLGACRAARFWRDLGTLEAYREAHFDGLQGRLPWPPPEPAGAPLLQPGAEVSGAVHCGRDVVVEAGARLVGPAVVGDGCRVAAGATVARSVLLGHNRVGRNACVRDSVLDEGAVVPEGCHVGQAGVGTLLVPDPGAPDRAARSEAPALRDGYRAPGVLVLEANGRPR